MEIAINLQCLLYFRVQTGFSGYIFPNSLLWKIQMWICVKMEKMQEVMCQILFILWTVNKKKTKKKQDTVLFKFSNNISNAVCVTVWLLFRLHRIRSNLHTWVLVAKKTTYLQVQFYPCLPQDWKKRTTEMIMRLILRDAFKLTAGI